MCIFKVPHAIHNESDRMEWIASLKTSDAAAHRDAAAPIAQSGWLPIIGIPTAVVVS